VHFGKGTNWRTKPEASQKCLKPATSLSRW